MAGISHETVIVMEHVPLKPIFAACALVTLWIIESVAPMFVERDRRLSHNAANLALGLINAVLMAVCFGTAMLFVTEWAQEKPFGLFHWISAPAWIAWPMALILFDAWMYTWHRLNHRVPFLWRFHAVHHADREMDASSALRFHTGEMALSGFARLAILPVIGLTMPQLLVYETILLPVILFHHSNIRIPPQLDRMLRVWIVTPWMHWVHHSNWQPETDSNYSSVLSVWDRLFGTFRLRDDPKSINLGLEDDTDEAQWRTLTGMLARPFRSRKKRNRDDH